MSTAISVEQLSKSYRLGMIGGSTLREDLSHWWAHARQRPDLNARIGEEHAGRLNGKEFWALRDVSFTVKEGEILGIIGSNGAGKSTLLKILSRVTGPTSGCVKIKGRIASLLEVGTGFHPELTGRENIFLNGTILGMTRAEIRKKFDEIVAFAEIDEFIDTPVKRYSSGMYVRLAFAVAAHLEPEILVVDEVLAVGDAQFQKKCLGKMQDVSQREGRTVLFVSHNMAAISTLTNRVIVLKKGAVVYAGSVQKGIDLVLSEGTPQSGTYTAAPLATRPNFTRVEIKCSESGQSHDSGKPWEVVFQIHSPSPVPKACLSFQIVNQDQCPVLHLCAYDTDIPLCPVAGFNTVSCKIPHLSLNVGHYHLKAYLSEPPGGQAFDVLDSVCSFDVIVLERTTLFGWRPDACVYLESGTWTKSP
jgi:lipopolysaccharide transport system ATP-binding protein